MAAPETASLKRQRYTMLGLCVTLALATVSFPRLKGLIGPAAIYGLVALMIAAPLYCALYLARKHIADSAWLDREGEGDE